MWGKTGFAIAAGIALSMLSACADDLVTLKNTTPEGSAFNRNLADEYRRFAVFEADQMFDWPDAKHFALKGLAAAQGNAVGPENPGDWSIPSAVLPDIKQARRRLAAIFETGVRSGEPETSARAQARFDCWVEQQEENWQTDHIAACRNSFMAALEKLEDTPEVQTARFTLVLFPFDSATIKQPEYETLATLIGRARGLGFADVSVTGHTDRAGPDAYNMDLSLRRAQAVREALIRRGLPPTLIGLAAKGETEPRVATADGVREALNRRVEILLAKPEAATTTEASQIAVLW